MLPARPVAPPSMIHRPLSPIRKSTRRFQMRAVAKHRSSAGVLRRRKRLWRVTGKYIGEGFDDARLDTLFLTSPISWKGILQQYAGRLHRAHHAKRTVIVYDYVDVQISMARRMFERRKRGYMALGYSLDDPRQDELKLE